MWRPFGALAAVGTPVIKNVLDAGKIASCRADSYELLWQPKLIHISILSYSLNLVRKHLKQFLEKVFVKITQFRVCPSSVSIDYTLLLGARRSCGQYHTYTMANYAYPNLNTTNTQMSTFVYPKYTKAHFCIFYSNWSQQLYLDIKSNSLHHGSLCIIAMTHSTTHHPVLKITSIIIYRNVSCRLHRNAPIATDGLHYSAVLGITWFHAIVRMMPRLMWMLTWNDNSIHCSLFRTFHSCRSNGYTCQWTWCTWRRAVLVVIDT